MLTSTDMFVQETDVTNEEEMGRLGIHDTEVRRWSKTMEKALGEYFFLDEADLSD